MYHKNYSDKKLYLKIRYLNILYTLPLDVFKSGRESSAAAQYEFHRRLESCKTMELRLVPNNATGAPVNHKSLISCCLCAKLGALRLDCFK